jgi:beta-N-acetylhexosaminidase
MSKVIRFTVILLLVLSFVIPQGISKAATNSQELDARVKASAMLAKMSPAEKVGQLFLVTFNGTATDPDSNIYKLITQQHIGGVELRSDNDNFVGSEDTITAVHTMIEALQQVKWDYTHGNSTSTASSDSHSINYVPLLIGISQEGDLAPYDQLINGMTPLPDEMAIGATWKPENAQTVGTILGEELSALGVNMLFGPSLDVLDVVKNDTSEDLGVRTFGGDPYWVAEMGQAYIKGVHEGSSNKIAVIATHFPGSGGSDRQPEDEVATVRKSLEQLKQIELAPFFAVTGQNEDPAETTDGLLLSHIRYQGFQGNIRATTRPVSFDSTALGQIMSLNEFSTWQKNGGIIVSDDLGSAAVRKFFDPLNTGFDARQVMKSALLAGNDLLYTGNILATGDADTYTTIARTHDFFVQKYTEDSAFQQRVDEAVLRVLTLKYELYPIFNISSTLTPSFNLDTIGTSEGKVFEIARQSITLVSPDLSDMDSVLPEPPQNSERVVFISDTINEKQCSTCADQNISLANNFRDAVEKLYGPNAGEQVESYKLAAYSFENLRQLLDSDNPPEYMKNDIQSANWLVISFTDFKKSSEASTIFHRFFSEQPDLTRNKKIIGFAFNAPYYLDATDISKFTAYYAVYSKIPVYVDVAARILFQEIVPSGILPVSLTSIGYDLISATTPNPDQIIPLLVEEPGEELGSTETPSSSTAAPLTYKVGDTIPLRTGVIVDHNGNPVPDGTVVRFLIDTKSTSGSIEQIETQTTNGIARTTYRIQNIGIFNIRVTADPAQISQILNLDITDAGGQITSFEPTIAPTGFVTPTLSTDVQATPESQKLSNHERGMLSAGDWFLSSLIIFSIAVVLYWWGWRRQKYSWNPRIPFGSILGGYVVYFYFVIGLPGAVNGIKNTGSGLILLGVIIGCLLGGGIGYIWYRLERSKKV